MRERPVGRRCRIRERSGRSGPQDAVGDFSVHCIAGHFDSHRGTNANLGPLAAAIGRQGLGDVRFIARSTNSDIAAASDVDGSRAGERWAAHTRGATDHRLGIVVHDVDRDRSGHADLAAAGARRRPRDDGITLVDHFLARVSGACEHHRLALVGVVPRGCQLEMAASQVNDVVGRAVGQAADRGAVSRIFDSVVGTQQAVFTQIQFSDLSGRIELDPVDQIRNFDVRDRDVLVELLFGTCRPGAEILQARSAAVLGVGRSVVELDRAVFQHVDVVVGSSCQAADCGVGARVVQQFVARLQPCVEAEEDRFLGGVDNVDLDGRCVDLSIGNQGLNDQAAGTDDGTVADECPIRDVGDVHRNRYPDAGAAVLGRGRAIGGRMPVGIGHGLHGQRATGRDVAGIGNRRDRRGILDVDRHRAGHAHAAVGCSRGGRGRALVALGRTAFGARLALGGGVGKAFLVVRLAVDLLA